MVLLQEVGIMESNITIVTGIWDLQRDQAGEGFKRPFTHYKENFAKLLKADVPMIVFVEKELEGFVWQYRNRDNTEVKIKDANAFKNNFDFYDKIQQIRGDKEWLGQAGWLKDSTQASLELYNPMVMSKMFMLHDSHIWNPFGTEYFAWIDGGITNTVHEGYFTKDRVFDKVTPYMDKFFFLSFPYTGNTEIHGFARDGMNDYAESESVDYVCRGGFFGGHIKHLSEVNGHYYGLLADTLANGYMGTEESIFTLMAYQKPELYKRFMIEGNGLVNTFFEKVKNDKVTIEKPPIKVKRKKIDIDVNDVKTSMYAIGFNSPEQFEMLCSSWSAQENFITSTNNYLIDNSTDPSTDQPYESLCKKYNFTRIKKDNIGICGGRQFVAEHFHEGSDDFYIFLEDDMLLRTPGESLCKNGFRQHVPDLYNKLVKIMIEEGFDFLKMCFTEFYGDNNIQWSWYNVPQIVRSNTWPEKPKLPKQGLDPDAPRTKFNNINTIDGLSYVDGEVYYCNWPQIVNRKGNEKMFIETKFSNPFEQTWMSYIFQETIKGNINPGLLLASPIFHNRIHHYAAAQRREN